MRGAATRLAASSHSQSLRKNCAMLCVIGSFNCLRKPHNFPASSFSQHSNSGVRSVRRSAAVGRGVTLTTTVAPSAARVVEAPPRTAPTPLPAAAAAESEAEEPPPGLTAAHLPRPVSRALAYEVDEERTAPAVADGVVPLASWWSDREVSRYAPPGGAPREWCRKPPPCAAPKPELPSVAPPSEKPRLTTELAKAHASKDNLLIVTYVNANRLDFVYTFVKHLIALGQRGVALSTGMSVTKRDEI